MEETASGRDTEVWKMFWAVEMTVGVPVLPCKFFIWLQEFKLYFGDGLSCLEAFCSCEWHT